MVIALALLFDELKAANLTSKVFRSCKKTKEQDVGLFKGEGRHDSFEFAMADQ